MSGERNVPKSAPAAADVLAITSIRIPFSEVFIFTIQMMLAAFLVGVIMAMLWFGVLREIVASLSSPN